MFILCPIVMLCQTTWSALSHLKIRVSEWNKPSFLLTFFRSDVASQKLANELIISVLHETQHHKHSINAAMKSPITDVAGRIKQKRKLLCVTNFFSTFAP